MFGYTLPSLVFRTKSPKARFDEFIIYFVCFFRMALSSRFLENLKKRFSLGSIPSLDFDFVLGTSESIFSQTLFSTFEAILENFWITFSWVVDRRRLL